jgi:hypothetical protein
MAKKTDVGELLVPRVKYLRTMSAVARLKIDGRVGCSVNDPVVESAIRQVFGPTGKRVEEGAASVRCRIVGRADYGDRPHRREFFAGSESYCLESGPTGVEVLAPHAAGLRHGLMTLEQLIRRYGGALPRLTIIDWPDLDHRGYMLALVQGHNTCHPEYARHVVRQIARLKMNALYLYLENSFQFPFDPMVGGKRSMTPAQARELDAYAARHGIQVIPMLNVLGHANETLGLERYRSLAEVPKGQNCDAFTPGQFCPTNPAALRFVEKMIAELSTCFRSEIIHVGGDEAGHLGACPRCAEKARKRGKPRLFADYFNAISRAAAKRGRRIGIWGDMLLNHRPEGPGADKKHTIDLLDRGIVVYDWHYDSGSPESLRYFAGRDAQVVASSSTQVFICNCVWPEQELNEARLFGDCKRAGARGALLTNWTNYLGAHDENFWLLVASGADIMWSSRREMRKGMSRAFAFHRYGLMGDALPKYIDLLGSLKGAMCGIFGKMNNTNLRQTLYNTDNPLRFWHDYCAILTPAKLRRWKSAIAEARRLWRAARAEKSAHKGPYFPLLEAPLRVHEHLLRRYEMSLELKRLWHEAAMLQGRKPKAFSRKLRRAAETVEKHRGDFGPVLDTLEGLARAFGNEIYSARRVLRARRNLAELAALLRHLARSRRPLSAFAALHNVFFERLATPYWADREDEWADAPDRLARYSVTQTPWVWGPHANAIYG